MTERESLQRALFIFAALLVVGATLYVFALDRSLRDPGPTEEDDVVAANFERAAVAEFPDLEWIMKTGNGRRGTIAASVSGDVDDAGEMRRLGEFLRDAAGAPGEAGTLLRRHDDVQVSLTVGGTRLELGEQLDGELALTAFDLATTGKWESVTVNRPGYASLRARACAPKDRGCFGELEEEMVDAMDPVRKLSSALDRPPGAGAATPIRLRVPLETGLVRHGPGGMPAHYPRSSVSVSIDDRGPRAETDARVRDGIGLIADVAAAGAPGDDEASAADAIPKVVRVRAG